MLTQGDSNKGAINAATPAIVAMGVSQETTIGDEALSAGRVSPDLVNQDHRDRAIGVVTNRGAIKPPVPDPKIPVRAPARDIVIVGEPAVHPNNNRTTAVLTTGAQIRTNRSGVRPNKPDRVAVIKPRATTRVTRDRTTETSLGKTDHRSTRHAARDSRTAAAQDRASNAETTRTETTDASDSSSSARTGRRLRPTSSR